jgi:hypothetical protein
MMPAVVVVVGFALVWLLAHGRILAAAVLALLALPGVLFGARRR